MAVEIPESVRQSLVTVACVLGGVAVLILFIGGAHQLALGLAALFFLASIFAFIEARHLAHARGHTTSTSSSPQRHASSATAAPRAVDVKAPAVEPIAPLQLQGARLDGGRLDGLNFTGASLIELSAVGSDLRKVLMQGANLTGANLKDVNLFGVTLDEVNLTRAKLDGANLSGVNASNLTLHGASLDQTRFARSHITRSDLRELRAPRLDLNASTFAHVNMTGARLERADLRQVTWTEVDLRQASLLECKMQEGEFTGLMARGVKMPGCVLDGASLPGADFRDALMFKASLKKANLRETLWDGADLRDVNLSEADLGEASLKGVNLSGANLSGANLSGASLLDTDLSTCIHNMLTTWPEGVEPSQLISTLDEASLPEIVEEVKPLAPLVKASSNEVDPGEGLTPALPDGDEIDSSAESEEGRPTFNIKNIPKIHIRKPSRAVQKTMPLDDQDLQLMHEGLVSAASPPPLTTSVPDVEEPTAPKEELAQSEGDISEGGDSSESAAPVVSEEVST